MCKEVDLFSANHFIDLRSWAETTYFFFPHCSPIQAIHQSLPRMSPDLPQGVAKSYTDWPWFPEVETYQDTQDCPGNNIGFPGMVDIVLFCFVFFLTLAASSGFPSQEKFPNLITTVVPNALWSGRIHNQTWLQNPQASLLLLTEWSAVL